MKKINLIALAVISGIIYPSMQKAIAMDLDKLEASIRGIDQKVQQIEQAHLHDSETIVIVGHTGVGKTSLVYYLAGEPLSVKRAGMKWLFHVENPREGFVIGHTLQRGTEDPCIWYDAQNNRKFIDFPGFNDPGGAYKQIINAYFAKQLIQNQNKVKIIFAISEGDFYNPRSPALSANLKEFLGVFESDDQLKQGLTVVITRQQEADPEEVFNDLSRAINEGKAENFFDGAERVRELIRVLANNPGSRVAIFPKPLQEGKYSAPNELAHILENLKSLQGINKPQICLAVNAEAREIVLELGHRLNKSLGNNIKKLITDHCLKKINNFQGPTLKALRGELRTFSSRLEGLLPLISSEAPLRFAKELENLLNAGNLSNQINSITLLKSINDKILFDTTTWAMFLKETMDLVRNLSLLPQQSGNLNRAAPQYTYQNGALFLKGPLLGTSDVNTLLKSYPNIQTLNIWGLNTLIFDEDITSPSTSCYFIAPQWKVKGNRTINLRGKDGVQGTHGAGSSGAPGGVGGCGQNGGHFYGKAQHAENIHLLTLNLSGGNGGNGGNGAQGAKGSNGESGRVGQGNVKVLNFQQKSARPEDLVDPPYYPPHKRYINSSIPYDDGDGRTIRPYIENNTFNCTTTTYLGINGDKGGQGGAAGAGGAFGNPGTAILHLDSSSGGVRLLNEKGRSGNNGIPGAGGIGGLHGPHLVVTEKRYRLLTHCSRPWKSWTHDITKDLGVPFLVDTLTEVLQHHGSAPYGEPGEGLNTAGQERPVPQNSLNERQVAELIQKYSGYYQQQASEPEVCLFIKEFPNLLTKEK